MALGDHVHVRVLFYFLVPPPHTSREGLPGTGTTRTYACACAGRGLRVPSGGQKKKPSVDSCGRRERVERAYANAWRVRVMRSHRPGRTQPGRTAPGVAATGSRADAAYLSSMRLLHWRDHTMYGFRNFYLTCFGEITGRYYFAYRP